MSDFGEHYERIMKDEEQWGEERVHVSCVWKLPNECELGEWAMYLPLEITEGANMAPRMARIQNIEFHHDVWNIVTNLGVMTLRRGEKLQVVT